jgi:hypothetical protein
MRFLFACFLALVLMAPTALALEKDNLVPAFADDFESGMDRWTLLDPLGWRVEQEPGTENHVLSLHDGGGVPRDYDAPRSVAMLNGLAASDFIFEARMRHRGDAYGHQDLCVIYNVQDDYKFYYTHIAPVSDEGANTIFLVDNAQRRSIADERTDGTAWGESWHDVRIVRDTEANTIAVFFDDMSKPIMTAEDDTFEHGRFGIGSYNDEGWFDDVKIWVRPEDAKGPEYVSIFDGETLDGWQAPDMRYWSIEDGAITAESTPEKPCDLNQFLVWQGGEVADFELKLQFRLGTNKGNSGIQFRSFIAENGMGTGYQADIIPGGPWAGAIVDEYTSREALITPNGHRTIAEADGEITSEQVWDPISLRPAGEWNDGHLLALGHRIVFTINGQTASEFIDRDAKEFDPAGILALQLRSGDPMKVQFREIYLKRYP